MVCLAQTHQDADATGAGTAGKGAGDDQAGGTMMVIDYGDVVEEERDACFVADGVCSPRVTLAPACPLRPPPWHFFPPLFFVLSFFPGDTCSIAVGVGAIGRAAGPLC